MNRRGFLRALGAAAVGMTIDPERLLWRPGAKTIVVMNGNPFWSSQLPTSYGILSYEMLQKTIEQIERQTLMPPREINLITSPAIKRAYERMLVEPGDGLTVEYGVMGEWHS
jgi:hypothetical protein